MGIAELLCKSLSLLYNILVLTRAQIYSLKQDLSKNVRQILKLIKPSSRQAIDTYHIYSSQVVMKYHNQASLLSFLGLSLATSPFIVSIILLQVLGELLKNCGEASEEIFRAEQLPLLNITELENLTVGDRELD